MDAEAASIYPPQAPQAMIRVHQATDDRLVLDIPPGGGGGIGLFAVLWNGFMAVFTAIIYFSLTQKQAPDFSVFPVLLIALFWLVGFGLVYAWIKLRFERCFLLVDRDRAVLRKMLFRCQKQAELELDDGSRAQLTESYKENDVPVYRITIAGAGGKVLHFGTSLKGVDKDWCVDAVNALLKPPAVAATPAGPRQRLVCEACGQVLPKDAFRTEDGRIICPACEHQQAAPASAPLLAAASAEFPAADDAPLPDELPGVVTVLEDSPERLAFSLSWTEFPTVWRIAVAVTMVGALFWTAFTGGNLTALIWFDPKPADNDIVAQWAPVVFAVPIVLGILAAWGAVAAVTFGRLRSTIDAEQVTVRFHVGPFGRSWKLPTREITSVRITTRQDFPSQAGNARSFNPRVADPGSNNSVATSGVLNTAAAVFAGPRVLLVTLVHQRMTARFVAEMVRRWLHDTVPDVRI